jgi:CBS domain-containing protein
VDTRPAELALELDRVRDLVGAPAVTCPASLTAPEVAALLSRHRARAVVVLDEQATPVGIVTDVDLRQKIVAAGREPAATAARDIMSAPLITIGPDAFTFEAVLEMTRHDVHHLVVIDGGRLIGVISSDDLLRRETADPVVLAREINHAVSLDALATLGRQITQLVRRLVAAGAAAYAIGRIVAELNDRMVARVLDLAAGALAAGGQRAPETAYCWLSFGSEARLEQTLRTDQDNGLVYADPPPELSDTVARYYQRFSSEVVRSLVQVGFPACPGDAMASNPRWCQPFSVWSEYFDQWLRMPRPEQVLAACIYFDVRPLAGATQLGAGLRDLIRREAPGRELFLGLLARDVVDRPVALSIFKRIAAHRHGPHRGAVDIKGGGSMQLVGAGRVHALALGSAETNTIDRIRAAADHGGWDAASASDVTDAYQHLMRLRLAHQLQQLARGEPLDNYVAVDRLSHTDALLLRDALKTVTHVQSALRERFATDLLPG